MNSRLIGSIHLLFVLAFMPYVVRAQSITIDGKKTGRVFEGVGAVSAGASSRLLIDYPEPQRRQILDFLFKPYYGAGIQHLKVEIGGDVDSTDGCEPSHMHTRNDLNFERGYEWWLMSEAKKRNPHIFLDTLAWGAPAWVGNGNYYSQDMADYVAKFLQGAKSVYGLNIDYTGIWNERTYNADWVKLLRKTLDQDGLNSVRISAPDNFDWSIVNAMQKDPELNNAVYAIGEHYMNSQTTQAAKDCGKPLWSSEDSGGHSRGDWSEAVGTARLLNRNYILGKITKTEIWSPITSYYSILPAPNSGLMNADTPWSGYYEVPPTVWAVAQTTQFAQPGWRYLEGEGNAVLDGIGSYVTFLSPDKKNYSIVLETTDTHEPHTLTFNLTGGLSENVIHVWCTNYKKQFVHIQDIKPISGSFSIHAEGQSIYSLTTTKGQKKGITSIPKDHSLPDPYSESFDEYPIGGMPRYFTDQAGIFEVARRADGNGNILRQIMSRKGIEWMGENAPLSLMGDERWTDCDVSVDALIEKSGSVALYGHIMQMDWNGLPEADWLTVAESGKWELHAGKNIISSGSAHFSADTWHNLRLKFDGSSITAFIDGNQITQVHDESHSFGLAGIGSGWNPAEFDNFKISFSPPPVNLALYGKAVASSQWSEEYSADKANDGQVGTRWNSADGTSAGEWLAIHFKKPEKFNRVVLRQLDDRITKYRIQYLDNGSWRDAYTGSPMTGLVNITFPTVTSSAIRLYIDQTRDGITPSIYEFEVYDTNSKLKKDGM